MSPVTKEEEKKRGYSSFYTHLFLLNTLMAHSCLSSNANLSPFSRIRSYSLYFISISITVSEATIQIPIFHEAHVDYPRTAPIFYVIIFLRRILIRGKVDVVL